MHLLFLGVVDIVGLIVPEQVVRNQMRVLWMFFDKKFIHFFVCGSAEVSWMSLRNQKNGQAAHSRETFASTAPHVLNEKMANLAFIGVANKPSNSINFRLGVSTLHA